MLYGGLICYTIGFVVTILCLGGLGFNNKNSENQHDPFPEKQWHTTNTIAIKTVVSTNFARFQVHKIKHVDGKISDNWLWTDEMPHVNILVHLKIENRFLVFSQKKYGLLSEKLATVGGLFNLGESPSDCAQRELLEETGLLSENLLDLGEYRVQADRGGGMLYPFFAKDCVNSKISKKMSDDYEKQQKMLISFDELIRAAKDAKFGEIQWLATVVLSILSIMQNSSDNAIF